MLYLRSVKVRFIKWKNVVDHCESNRIMKNAFENFYYRMSQGDFQTPQDIISGFGNSDLVTCKKTNQSRFVFNIGMNKYRLICGYFFAPTSVILYIKFVGTLNEYDKINVCEIDMFKTK